jgi:hypothetical protein
MQLRINAKAQRGQPQPKFEQEITEGAEKKQREPRISRMSRMKDWKRRPCWLNWMLCKNNLLAMAALPTRLYKNMLLAFKEFFRVSIVSD